MAFMKKSIHSFNMFSRVSNLFQKIVLRYVMKNLKEIIKIHGNERFLLENKNKRQNNKIK